MRTLALIEPRHACQPVSRPPSARKLRLGIGKPESGQAVVEFALVLPMLLLILVAIIKFGLVYNNYIQLTNSVDTGARLFSEERGQAAPCTDAANEVVTAAGGLNLASLRISMQDLNIAGAPYTVMGNDTSTPVAGSGTCPTTTMKAGDPASVTATYPCDLKILAVNFSFGCTLSATATENTQ
jgi:Flp pilus assembly protein TadG